MALREKAMTLAVWMNIVGGGGGQMDLVKNIRLYLYIM
jgi:hypothetical protein